MIGSRAYINEEGKLWLANGDYGQDISGLWHARPPGMHSGNLKNHEVTEHEDGTITVKPSILITEPRSDKIGLVKWHGYLTAGVWRES